MKVYLKPRGRQLRILNLESNNSSQTAMKKTLFVLSLATCISISAQKKYDKIINSTNITEIENFLKVAHPDDTRRMILKRKLVSLKNDQWMKGYKRTFIVNTGEKSNSPFAQKTIYTRDSHEEEEFLVLMEESTKFHQEKTVGFLNQLFDNDITNDKAILIVKNEGNCNMIVRIQGSEQYNLAVPANGENFVTVKKGEYRLSGNRCDARYYAAKSIGQNLMITLNKTSAGLMH